VAKAAISTTFSSDSLSISPEAIGENGVRGVKSSGTADAGLQDG